MGIETRRPASRYASALKYSLLLLGIMGCGKIDGGKGAEASLEELNRAYKSWGMMRGSYPQDLNELTNFPALQGRPLPKLPPGKKLVIDSKTREIVIADQ